MLENEDTGHTKWSLEIIVLYNVPFLPWSLVKPIDQKVNFYLDLLEWLEMLPINPSL